MKQGNYNLFLKQLNEKHLDAFQLLYDYYYKILVLYAINFVEQEVIAEDIVQDLFISIWEKDVKFDSLTAFKTFLYNSVRNSSLNYLKHLQVEEKFARASQQKGADTDELFLEIEEQEIYRQLFKIIEELPVRCREIFEMHLQGKKNNEIASLLALSIETVKTQKKRAMRHLRRRLGVLATSLLLTNILP